MNFLTRYGSTESKPRTTSADFPESNEKRTDTIELSATISGSERFDSDHEQETRSIMRRTVFARDTERGDGAAKVGDLHLHGPIVELEQLRLPGLIRHERFFLFFGKRKREREGEREGV